MREPNCSDQRGRAVYANRNSISPTALKGVAAKRRICSILLVVVLALFSMTCKKEDNNPATPTTGAIQGEVTNVTGDTVIAGAIVTTSPATSSVSTNAQGAYSIPNVSPGQYSVMAAKGGYNPGSVNVTVVAGQTTTANIHLSYLAANSPPSPPNLVFPPDGSTNQATTLTLSWSCSDPDGDPLTYDVYFGKTASPSAIVSPNQSGTTLLRSGLDTSTTYYWKVIAKDNRGASTSGNVWRFTTRRDTIPTQGLVAYYPFNGNANDESGNGNNGTVHGVTLTTSRFGSLNNAYSFDGSSNYITLPPTISMSYELSVSFWIKTSQSDPGGGLGARFLISRDLPGLQRDWTIGLGNGGRIQFTTGTQSNDYTLLSSIDINDNTWKHIVIVRDIATTSKKIYVNGQISNTTTFDNQPFTNNTSYIYVGTSYSMNGFYNGVLDDIRIFNRALTDTEIQTLYHEGGW